MWLSARASTPLAGFAELSRTTRETTTKNNSGPPKQQIGFYNFVVKPMYEAMAMLVPLDRQFDNLEAAAAHWRSKLPTEDEAPGTMAPPKIDLRRQLSQRVDSTPPASPKPSR